ncbi:MAG TPA: family 1 glycosylhydrolase [Vitreimonas sp.]|nr:family 1 glycosylhydrolase [Vitreimonas sp.]
MTVTTAIPPLEPDHGFVVASGIECSAPLVAGGVRQDELRTTGHWDRYAEDLALVAGWGIRYLRYGVPFHVVDRDPQRRDWAWTDRAFGTLRELGIEPIADLLHFGVPDDLRGFGDPRLPDRFVSYARAFAERYPWARWYTPVNEPLVGATFSAHLGWWNERAADERSFVAAIDGASACAAAGMAAIRERRPDAVFVQSDACETWQATSPAALEHVAFLRERRFVSWDLAYGRRPAESVTRWLAANGLGEERLAWYAEHGSDQGCIVGHDYYAGNEWMVGEGGIVRSARSDERAGYAAAAREYHAHFGLPFMLSETNLEGAAAPAWLARTWNDTLQLRLEGFPVRGYTWYGFVDHVDWDSCLRDVAGRPNACGLVDHDRQAHPVGLLYRDLAHAALRGEFRPLPVDEAALAAHQSAIPAFVEELASGPTAASGDASA